MKSRSLAGLGFASYRILAAQTLAFMNQFHLLKQTYCNQQQRTDQLKIDRSINRIEIYVYLFRFGDRASSKMQVYKQLAA